MPGVNGAELARLAQSRRTALPIVFVTGYVDTASLGEIGEERMSRSIRERQACEYSTRGPCECRPWIFRQNSATQTLKLASDARSPDSSPHR
jgi:CheY-like chemotaxis protein